MPSGAGTGSASVARRGSWAFAALLASLSMLGPFAIDMYLPAFGAIAAEFGTSAIAVQQTLSAYLFAYAFMMLWHGALSDAWGRRPVIMGGLGSMWGTLAGGIILGVAQTVGAQLDPGWNLLAGHIAFLVVLALRPEGLFPKVQG